MGGGSYSHSTRAAYVVSIADKEQDEIFTNSYVSRETFKKKSKMTPYNLKIREARDSEEHPVSIPVIIALDVTGSMGRIPEKIIKNDLTIIMNIIINAGIEHTQIMFLAIGDHLMHDNSPLQVGQFESSDELMHTWLEEIDIESGGGGNSKESYHLAWLVAGHHVETDHFEKRGKKGYLFTIGDEGLYEEDDPKAIQELIGTPGEKWNTKEILKKAQKQFNVYHIHTDDGSYPSTGWGKKVVEQWKEYLGENVFITETYHEIAQKMADIIVQGEGMENYESTKEVEVLDPTSDDIPAAPML